MAKRKKKARQIEDTEATHITLNLPIPKHVFTFCAQVASLAETSVNTVVCVVLAAEIVKRYADDSGVKP